MAIKYSYTPTAAVKSEIKNSIKMLTDIPNKDFKTVYDATVLAVSKGGDLRSLSEALLSLGMDSLTKRRVANICLFLNRRSKVIIDNERMLSLGITEAIWRHSGAPCEPDSAWINGPSDDPPPSRPTKQAVNHKSADNRVYKIREGLLIDGGPTWPGRAEGCRCYHKPIIPALSSFDGYRQAKSNETIGSGCDG